jgi:cytochrome P450
MTETGLDVSDLTDLDRFAGGFPHDAFTMLRRDAPVWWQQPTAHTPDGEGFWVISRHADVLDVLRDYSDRDLAGTSDRMLEAAIGMRVSADALIAEKRQHPADDMFSTVVHATAEADGGAVEAMSVDELQAFFSLLPVAVEEILR